MNKQLIISLISDQTIPNVQIIKEYGTAETDYLFILTEGMKKKGIADWVKDACKIETLDPIIVNEYSLSNIQEQLSKFDYSIYKQLIVNITGGTKIMTLGVYEFFKAKNANIYYTTRPKDKDFLHISQDGQNKIEFSPKSKITLKEYLTAYGFDVEETEQSGIDHNITKKIFEKYCEGVFDRDINIDALKLLREKRGKKIDKKDDYDKISDFLKQIDYIPKEENKLSKVEIKYLSGEWFEEYIGGEIKQSFSLSNDEILIGATIKKDISEEKELNPINDLLSIDIEKESPNNEIDVMFVKNNKFHIIECKTSIINTIENSVQKKDSKGNLLRDDNGNPITEKKTKQHNILGETLYKSDALKTKFGLFASSYIFTLTDFKEYAQNNNKQQQMIDLINRASISKIKLVDKSMLRNTQLEEIIK